MGTGEIFLSRIPIAFALRSRIDKWDLIKLQGLFNQGMWDSTFQFHSILSFRVQSLVKWYQGNAHALLHNNRIGLKVPPNELDP